MRDESEIIEREVRIAARPDTVYSFFTDPAKLLKWKGIKATLDARSGGLFRLDINGRDIVRGEFVILQPYSRIVFTWGWEGEASPLPPGSSTVEVSLIAENDATRLHLRHSGLPGSLYDFHIQGWDHYLPRLTMAAEGRDPGLDPGANA